jgi:hypothetical protein
VPAPQIDDALHAVELLAHAPHVAQLARVVGQRPEIEAVVGEDDERRVVVHGGDEVAHDPVGVDVHRLDRATVAAAAVRARSPDRFSARNRWPKRCAVESVASK